MDYTNLRLVYLTDLEMREMEKEHVRFIRITDALNMQIRDVFYGGYSSGTSVTGSTPNAIIFDP